MINKCVSDAAAAVRGVPDGATVLISGFGEAGSPTELIHALIDQGARDLTVVSNNAGSGASGLAALLAAGRVRRIVCSYPRSPHSQAFDRLYATGHVELELTPQGTLAERLRAAGSGIGAFFTPTGAGTDLARGKEQRVIEGRTQILEHALRGTVALVKADAADRWGNLIYRKAARNFGPLMCAAADLTVVQVRRVVDLGDLDPEQIVTPGLFVDRVIAIPDPRSERDSLDRETRS